MIRNCIFAFAAIAAQARSRCPLNQALTIRTMGAYIPMGATEVFNESFSIFYGCTNSSTGLISIVNVYMYPEHLNQSLAISGVTR